MAALINQQEIAQALAEAQARADRMGEPVEVGFVARYEDGSWVAVDGTVQPSDR